MKLRRAVGLAVGGALVLAAPALAQDPTTPTTPQPAPATPAPTPSMRLSTQQVTRGAVLAGDRWVLRGAVKPYVAGQRVTVRFYRGARKVRARELLVRHSDGSGRFRMTVRLTQPGSVTIRASHRATQELGTGVAPALRVQVLVRRAQPGSRGLAVRRLQAAT